jgi:hypothetical protein
MTAMVRRFMWRVDAGAPSADVTAALRRILSCAGHFVCGLSGHEMLRHFEANHLSLRCVHCGAQTTGWNIDVRPAFRRRTERVATRRDLTSGMRDDG